MRNSETTALPALLSAATNAWRWWLTELSELMPSALFPQRRREHRVILEITPAGARLLIDTGEKSRTIGTEPPLETDIGRLVQRSERRPTALRLAASMCLERRAELPESARASFDQMLRLQLERMTPFKSQDVYQAHAVTGRGTAKGMLSVRHVIVKRAVLDTLLETCRSAGAAVSSVDCWAADGDTALDVDFLGSPSTKGSPVPALALAAGIAILAAGGVVLDLRRHETALARIDAEVDVLRRHVQSAQSASRERESAVQDANRIIAAKAARPAASVMLEEITRLLPDDTVLQSLRIDRDIVDFTGSSASAIALLPLIEASPLFENARLTTPVSTDGTDARERFGIRMQLRSAKQPADSAVSTQPAGRRS